MIRPSTSARRRVIDRATVLTIVIGLVFTVVLAAGAWAVRDHNESVLLRQRTHEAGAVLSSAIPSVQLPMSAAAVLAESTDGSPAAFRRLFTPLVGAKGPFVSATLWSTATMDRPVVTVGQSSELTTFPAARRLAFLHDAMARTGMSALNLLTEPDRRLGYAASVGPATAHYVVYAEQSLPRTRRLKVSSDAAFSDLGYALYFGKAEDLQSLLYASEGDTLPIGGRRASVAVPFADSQLLLVMTPHKSLSGTLLARLPWMLAFAGTLLTLGAAALVEGLARRRKDAERLAAELDATARENERLYEQQREVAETLQHSLLPEALPQLSGVTISGRFAAGTPGIDIGGDWYDVMQTAPDRCLFVVGDVSGRGVRAGTIMAKLRYAVRAYAVAGDTPDGILEKLSRLINVRDGYFATVFCGVFDAGTRTLTIANAGHLPALLHDGTEVTTLRGRAGVPIGVTSPRPYEATVIDLAANGTLLTFTDGLVERRGEPIDAGLARVAGMMQSGKQPLDHLLDELLQRLGVNADDDTAMLGFQWNLPQ